MGFSILLQGLVEAVLEHEPLKILHSIAFIDSVNGVDFDSLHVIAGLSAGVGYSVPTPIGLLQVGITVGMKVGIILDFYDPNPKTSGGLVRPYQLLESGDNPFFWFQYGESNLSLHSLFGSLPLPDEFRLESRLSARSHGLLSFCFQDCP